MTLTLFFDGLCEPKNPGGVACFGWLLLDEHGHIVEKGNGVEARGRNATNNFAEWAALEHGLRAAVVHRPKQLEIRGDSQLVINQLTGHWRVSAEHLRPYLHRCLRLLEDFPWTAQWIPRRMNAAADALSWAVYHIEQGDGR